MKLFAQVFFGLSSAILSGCDGSDVLGDLEQLADQIIITYPANNAEISDSISVVRVDIPSSASAQKVTLYVDGIEVAADSDGAPWEISWPSYYWADDASHTLLLKTIHGSGREIRNTQNYQVKVRSEASSGLQFADGLDGMIVNDTNSIDLEFAPLFSATSYEVKYSIDDETSVVPASDISLTLTDLEIGIYTISYRAIQIVSDATTLTGPWSDSIKVEVFPVGGFTLSLGGSNDDTARKVISTSDGGFVVLGQTKSKEVSSMVDSLGDDWIIKVGGSGNIQWEKVVSSLGRRLFHDIHELSDGSLLVVGGNYDTDVGVATRMDSDGEDIWSVSYQPDAGAEHYTFTRAVEFDSEIFVAAREYAGSDSYQLHTIDIADGTVSDPFDVPEISGVVINSVARLIKSSQNELVIAGYALPESSLDDYLSGGPYIQVLNSGLNQQMTWFETGGGTQGNVGTMIELSNGNFSIVGQYSDYSGPMITTVGSNGSFVADYTDISEDYYYGVDHDMAAGENGHLYLLVKEASSTSNSMTLLGFGAELSVQSETNFSGYSGYTSSSGLVVNDDGTTTILFSNQPEGTDNWDIVLTRR